MGLARLLMVCGLFIFGFSNGYGSEKWESVKFVEGAETVSLDQVKKMLADGVLFIDVRSARQFGKRHIPGAINLFVNEGFTEENLLKKINKDSDFVVYCNGANCGLSSKAARKAVLWGFTGVKYFREGVKAWRLDGNPLEYGAQ